MMYVLFLASSNAAAEVVASSPSARVYIPSGKVCRPKNYDGYELFTGVDTPESCRDRCNSEPDKCGAYEFENYSLDNRECELHERSIISYQDTLKQGECELGIQGAYRCCWILENIVNGSSTSQNNNNEVGEDYTTTENEVFDTVVSVIDSILEVDESTFNTTESYTGEELNKPHSTVSSSNTSYLSASLADKFYIANFALLILSLYYSF